MNILSRRINKKTRQRKMLRRRRFSRLETLEARQLLAGDISGGIYNDLNGDGVRDQGEDGLANWTVFLDQNQSGTLDAGEPSALTNADGEYFFGGLSAGDYRVAELVRSGWTPTNPASGFQDVTLSDGQSKTVNFLNQGSGGTGVITGNVWRDINNNGIQDPEDTGLAGWTLYLDLNGDKVLDPEEPFVLTDGNGDYSFTGLLGGGGTSAIDYEVTIVFPTGWEPKDENITAAVIDGQTTSGIDFSNWPDPEQTTSISGRVFNDLNGNGVLNAGESGLGGWIVFADMNLNGVRDTGEVFGTTSSSGNYSLTGLESGNLRITVAQHLDYKSTSPASGFRNVNLVPGVPVSGVNFGAQLRTDAAIGGVIYVDRDKDGTRDPGEEGLPGITVYLDVDNSGSLTAGDPSMVTGEDFFYTPDVDEAGAYRFEKLGGGTYVVRQIVPPELDSPGSEIEHSVTVGPADDISDLELGDEYRPSEIHGIKFEDANGNGLRDPGEPGIEGVTIFIDLNRDNVFDDAVEPSTQTLADGSYSFVGLEADAYIVREIVPAGFVQTFPSTESGILWPEGVSNAAVGNVTPTLIETSLAKDETYTQTVSLTLPTTGALTNLVDVFLLFDDTGSFTSNSPIVRAAFPNIISQLQTKLPGIDLGFGVGRLEEYGGFASEYGAGRPFTLNQPIIASDVSGFSASIQSALDHVAPGYGGDGPETVIEALYQMVSGAGFDGNNNGSLLDSGAAGLLSTQTSPGNSGDVPAFSSFTPDPANGVLPASGTIGGAGFRSGALPIIITATDTGFAYQPKGETSIVGIDGLSVPVSQLTAASRGSSPFGAGAGIQETVTGLNALGALVIGLGTTDSPSSAPRQGLEALANLTGAINRTTNTIDNGTADAIAPNDPFYFKIGSGGDPLVGNIADGIVAAIDGAVTSVNVNVTLRASDPRVHLSFDPGVINGLGAGDTATFDVTFTGDGRPHRFDLQFIREGTDVVLGSIPVVLGTPVEGDGYEYEDCEDGEHSQEVNFGNQRIDGITPNVAPSFTVGADQLVMEDAGPQTVTGWATNVSPGPASESTQLIDFIVSTDNNGLFAIQPTVAPDGTLTFSPAADAFGSSIVTIQAHDDGGTALGGMNTSAAQTFVIEVSPVNDAPIGLPIILAQTIDGTGSITLTEPTNVQSGNLLTVDTSGISDADGLGTFSFQWLRDGIAVTAASSDTYLVSETDVDARISVQVSYTDGDGTLETLTSAEVGPVSAANSAPMGDVLVVGTLTEDEVLTADTSGITDADGLGAFSFLWSNGATTPSITLGDSDVGQNIGVTVSYTDGGGKLEHVASSIVGPVANVNDAPTGEVIVLGTPQNGQVLTADASGVSDPDGLGMFSYAWSNGATTQSITLGDSDVGQNISVAVSYTDGHGTNEGPLTSVPTAAVTDIASAGPKFFVVDQSQRRVFEYDTDGNALENDRLDKEGEKPRGIAANADGSLSWVVDGDGEVFVYNQDHELLGSWKLKEIDKPEGVTVHGDDLWIVDRENDRVHFFAGGALRRSGKAESTSSFRLDRANRNPMDVVTDGVNLWVVNDTRGVDKVFRYDMQGVLEGSWQIDAANAKPTGLTIDPSDVSHIWIVDSRSDSVYQYDQAAGRVSGSQDANASFKLAESNRNPQGIADPLASVAMGGARKWTKLGSSADDSVIAWNNVISPLDANDDGDVSALDALVVVNHLGKGRATSVADLDVDAPFVDTNADGLVTARDALVIVNSLKRQTHAFNAESIDSVISKLADREDERFTFENDFDDILALISRGGSRRD
ncbi:SdrD B-like domain-containing protein [Stieleria varia]|nr:SdrD B-like domain-containing protein [Stieleria varia]